MCLVWLTFFLIGFPYFSYGATGKFNIPPIKIETFTPKGIRVSIPDEKGIEMFAFNGQRNKPLTNVEVGEISGETLRPTGKNWVITDLNAILQSGDVIHYYYFVQFERLGFRAEERTYKVENLVPYTELADPCKEPSVTKINGGKNVCPDSVFFEDRFEGAIIDNKNWLVEEYIPMFSYGPSFEFVVYIGNTVNVADGMLKIKPKLLNKKDASSPISLPGCTKSSQDLCSFQAGPIAIRPPVDSGRIRTKTSFYLGKIEVKAKLPSGDWLFPIITLTPVDERNRQRILVAYARGNRQLTTENNEEIGGNVLYAGPYFDNSSSVTTLLASVTNPTPFSDNFHVYTLEWRQNGFTYMVDGKVFGKQDNLDNIDQRNNDFPEYYLTIGIGAGGIIDFPDRSRSGNLNKPWENGEGKGPQKFLKDSNNFRPTWKEETVALQVDYVKISSL